jgi:hypothetical protein
MGPELHDLSGQRRNIQEGPRLRDRDLPRMQRRGNPVGHVQLRLLG